MAQHLLVFDAGKTNKKLLLFNERLQVIDERKAQFAEYEQEGIRYERIGETVAWFKDNLAQLARRYPVDAVSVATHGATIACINEQGGLALPLVAYTTEPGPAFHADFYRNFGDPVDLQQQTATPQFGNLLSTAKTIYFLQQRFSREFSGVKHILNFPQYFGYLLTGQLCADPTCIGCHSYLWNFARNQWSGLARALGITDLLPACILAPWEVMGTVAPDLLPGALNPGPVPVTAGVHDSNASLLPYLVKASGDFVLNSTGTWCVVMRPAEAVCFRQEELGKSVFYNLSVFNKPVKTAIFMGGLEFETYLKLFRQLHGELPLPGFNRELADRLTCEKQLFILPSVVQGTGQFPASLPRVVERGREYPLAELQAGRCLPEFFRDYETALAVLKLSLAVQTRVALSRVGTADCSQLFIEGGFRRDDSYNALLTSLYPQTEVMLSNLEEATAFGAALLAKAALEGKNPLELAGDFTLDYHRVARSQLDNIREYTRAFLERVTG